MKILPVKKSCGTHNIMPLTAAPDDLRCHILDGPTEGVRPALSTTELLGKSKVGQHDVAFRVQENVLELDVTVDDAELMVDKRFILRKENIFFSPISSV